MRVRRVGGLCCTGVQLEAYQFPFLETPSKLRRFSIAKTAQWLKIEFHHRDPNLHAYLGLANRKPIRKGYWPLITQP